MDLTPDQKLWLLTAHPDTWELAEAPGWLSAECEKLGLVVGPNPAGLYKLTRAGHPVWRELRGED